MMNQSPPTTSPSDYEEGPDTLVARIPASVFGKHELLSILARELKFPDYFGDNWDALEECLRNLSWITAKRIVLLHESFPVQMGDDSLRVYLDILRSCVNYWESNSKHDFIVVLPDRPS